MTEIKNCLPEHARKHFLNLRNTRLGAETARYQQRLADLRAQLAARGRGRSGWQEMEEWKYKEELSDALATGYIQDAIETCDLYEIPLTESLCQCLLKATEEMLDVQYKNALQAQALGTSDVRIPLSVRQQGSMRATKIMPQIRVTIEKVRVEHMKKTEQQKQKHSDTSDRVAHSSIVVHGDVNDSTFQQGSHNVAVVVNKADIQRIAEEVKALIATQKFPKEDAEEISADIATAEAQLASPKPKHHIIRESLDSVRHVLEHAFGAALAHHAPLLLAYLSHVSK